MSSHNQHIQVLQRLDQIHQSSQTPLEDHERRFNRHAQPILQHPQYQSHLIQYYIKNLYSKDLRRSLRNRYKVMEEDGFTPTLLHIQQEARFLNRKFISIDAFRELYTLKQDAATPIQTHTYEIERRLALLEVPMEDDLLQDLYRKSLRPDITARLSKYSFNSYTDLRNAALGVSQ